MSEGLAATGIPAKPTWVRWQIFGLLFFMIAVNYVDRTTLSVAMPLIAREFAIPAGLQGLLLSSFFWVYALGQAPAGALVDRFLPRAVIAFATMLWGGFAALGAASTGWVFLLLTRVGLGAAESPIYPAGAKLAGLWLSRSERGRGAALLDGGAPIGAAAGALLIGAIIGASGSWRLGFLVAGVGTIACGLAAYAVIRNHPWEHARANQAERIQIASALQAERGDETDAPKSAMAAAASFFSAPGSWLLFTAWFCFNGQWYGALTWIPSYLYKSHGVDLAALGAFSSVIFLAGFFGDLAGGFLLDGLLGRGGDTRTSYRTVFGISSALATACVVLVPFVHAFWLTIMLLVGSQFFLRWCGTYWTLPALLAPPDRAGLLGGIMNLFGNLSGIVVPVVVGLIVGATGSYTWALLFFGLMGVGLFTCSMLMRYQRIV